MPNPDKDFKAAMLSQVGQSPTSPVILEQGDLVLTMLESAGVFGMDDDSRALFLSVAMNAIYVLLRECATDWDIRKLLESMTSLLEDHPVLPLTKG